MCNNNNNTLKDSVKNLKGKKEEKRRRKKRKEKKEDYTKLYYTLTLRNGGLNVFQTGRSLPQKCPARHKRKGARLRGVSRFRTSCRSHAPPRTDTTT